MLRASIEASGETADLRGILDPGTTTGIPHGDLLARFAEAVVARGPALAELRERIRAELGPEALADAAGTAGNFQRQVRIADAIGIQLDAPLAERSAAVREELGLERFVKRGD